MNLGTKLLAGVFALAVFASMAQADTIVFNDNFNTEHGGVGILNYAGFANWSVSDGTVDLIGNGFFEFSPVTDGHGLYVDLDGSTSNAGLMLSIPLNLTPGDYLLRFQLAGNQRNSTQEIVDINLYNGATSFFAGAILVGAYQPFVFYEIPFNVAAPMQFAVKFGNQGGDNIGALLDNVTLTQVVPEPATLLMIATGLGALVRTRRRR